MADPYDEEEKPLDPAVVRVQERLRRLMLIAGLTLGLGLLAVLAGIVYRIVITDPGGSAALPKDAATPTVSLSGLGLEPGARIVSSAMDGNRLSLTFADDTGTSVVIFEMPAMTVVGRLRVTAD
ncbi:hypothetical protein [Bauldia litoralis]|uniref:hypothetical protein n=1 Tax=Bauldia litoralis TaxID=665467 RepID=UPI003266746D